MTLCACERMLAGSDTCDRFPCHARGDIGSSVPLLTVGWQCGEFARTPCGRPIDELQPVELVSSLLARAVESRHELLVLDESRVFFTITASSDQSLPIA